MRWVSSSSNDVISFYSLADGVRHVLPSLYRVKSFRKCVESGDSDNSSDSPTSLRLRSHQRQQPENLQGRCGRAAENSATCERKSGQAGTAVYNSAASFADPNESSSTRSVLQAFPCFPSTEGELPVSDTGMCCSDRYYRDGLRQQSLGYVTTCVFSGGWGGYDETEVTVGTTEGYVYALPALWPPSAAFHCTDADQKGERDAVSACRSCCSASAVADSGAAVDKGGSATGLNVSCVSGQAPAAAREGQGEEAEETSSLPFPSSYVATPVKRFLRLPYTVQHLQMLGAHTPAVAGEYHKELFWLQQEHHRQRMSTTRSGHEENDVSEAEKSGYTARRSGLSCEGCGMPSCPSCVSCCCMSRPLLSTCIENSCDSYSSRRPGCYGGFSGTSSSGQTSAAEGPPASANRGQSSGHYASRVQEFFSSDRLLLALDKGGNGVVAHWPAPPYLQDSLLPPVTSTRPGRGQCSNSSSCRCISPPASAAEGITLSEADCVSDAATLAASTPLTASFTLNLSVQCCTSNPVATPLLAVVPSVVAAGGLRLLSVFDLVTTSFVFYARPPLTAGSRLAREETEQREQTRAGQREREPPHHRNHQPAYAEEARTQQSSRDPLRGRVWRNVCCLSRSPSVAVPLRHSSGTRTASVSSSCAPSTTGRGLPTASAATTARNMPISVSSLTWLPALHPLLLGASTNSGLLLLYDLRASPHPVFCAARPRSTGSATAHAGGKDAPSQTHGFADAPRKSWKGRAAAPVASPGAPEAASTARARLSGAEVPGSPQRAVPSSITGKEPVEGQQTESGIRRGSSLRVRSNERDGELACEKRGAARPVCPGSSGCSEGKRRRLLSEGGRYSGKEEEQQPMSISFLASPAWLTSAATSHDATILPCGCRCCRVRAAAFQNTEASSCASTAVAASTGGLDTTGDHHQEMQGSPASVSPTKSDSSSAGHSRHAPVGGGCRHQAAGCTHAKTHPGPASEVESVVNGIEHVSLFGGCAANVVLKPRNSSRPRPQRCRRRGVKGGRSCRLDKLGRTTVRTACCESAERPSGLLESPKKFAGGASHSEACYLSGEAVSTVKCAETCAVCGYVRRRRRKSRQTRETSWRDGWFAKQEKALINFFGDANEALLSKYRRSDEAACSSSMDTTNSAPMQVGDSMPCTNASHRYCLCSSDNCSTETARTDRRPDVGSGTAAKGQQEGLPAADGEPSVCSRRSQADRFAGNTGVRTTNEDGGTSGTTGCTSSADGSSWCRGGVWAGQNTYGELPFYLLRLASSPCSVLSGFPFTLWNTSKQVTVSLPCCPVRELPLRVSGISVAFLASCFFSLFARLLYAHRLDQHETARRLSHHQHRQLLKLLHAEDCRGSAILSQGPSAVDSAISAAAAAELAVTEARSAAVAARAAGVEVTRPASAAAEVCGTVELDAPHKASSFFRPSLASVPAVDQPVQGVWQAETPSNSLARKFVAFQDMMRSSPGCSSSCRSLSSVLWTPESAETFRTAETPMPLLDFERKLLSLYADVLLCNRRSRTVPRPARSEESSTVSPVRNTLGHVLPDLFIRHAQNCLHLLRYAADVLYAFGDGAPVLAQKSAAVGRAVQAAAACAAGLESEKYLVRVPLPAGAFRIRFSAEDRRAQQDSTDCAATPGKQDTTFRSDGVATQQASNDTQEGMDDRQLRCGCGHVEAAVIAKARRWLADEFITEARLAMKTSRSRRSMFPTPLEKPACFTVTGEQALPCRGERECSSAEEFLDEAHIVAAAHAVASSICLCELFQSATFFPVLFFNIFRRLRDPTTGIPFCIQKNCIRSLPVYDVAYQELARSQLRLLTWQPRRTRRAPSSHSASVQTQCLGNDVSGVPHQVVCAAVQATCPASSTYCDENVCRCRARAALPNRAAAAEHVARFDGGSCDRTRRLSKSHTRTQQLFCLDERGRVYVLLVSLRMARGRSNDHDSELQDRVNRTDSDVRRDSGSLAHRGMAISRNDKQPEGCVADGCSSQQIEIPAKHQSVYCSACSQSKGNEGAQKPDTAGVCSGCHAQLPGVAVCSVNQLTCPSDATDKHAVTPGQEQDGRPHQPLCVEGASLPGCSCTGKHWLWQLQGNEELLHLQENKEEFSCFSEDETGFGKQSTLRGKMWKERWLRRRRRFEWCGACRSVAKGVSPAMRWMSGNLCLPDEKKSAISADARQKNLIGSMWGPCSVKCQGRTFGGGGDHEPAEAAAELAISQAGKKVHLGRGRTPGVTRGTRARKKRVKPSAQHLNETDKLAIAERVTSTAAAARLAKISANMSLIRLFPCLPLWNSSNKPQYLRRLRRKLHKGRCSEDRILSHLICADALSHANLECQRGTDGGAAPYTSQNVGRCQGRLFPTCASPVSNKLKEVSDSAGPVSEGASVAPVIHAPASQSEHEGRKLAFPFASCEKSDTWIHGQSEEEESSDCCRRVCCGLHVEEEASFEINSKTSHGHPGSDNCRSRVVSLAIHENGGYVLAATCAPSFLLYCSSSVDPLPPYEHKDRLLFGCATGTIPPSRPFRLLSASYGTPSYPVKPICTPHPHVPTVLLPGAPLGPRPPPPVLISASPILPSGAAAPFVPHTLLRQHADHGVHWAVSSDGSISTRRLTRCRSGIAASLGRQSVQAEYGAGVRHPGDMGQAAFSDWLTDEEDEKELCGDASGSETGSASDS